MLAAACQNRIRNWQNPEKATSGAKRFAVPRPYQAYAASELTTALQLKPEIISRLFDFGREPAAVRVLILLRNRRPGGLWRRGHAHRWRHALWQDRHAVAAQRYPLTVLTGQFETPVSAERHRRRMTGGGNKADHAGG